MYLAENILLLDQQYGCQQGARESLLTLENLAKIYRTSTTHYIFNHLLIKRPTTKKESAVNFHRIFLWKKTHKKQPHFFKYGCFVI